MGLSEMPNVYERFTDRARKVMQLANQEARRFNHEYIGTEHILLGLVQEGSGVAANALKNLDIDLRKIRREVERIVQSGPDMVTMGKLPQTPRAKKVIEYSIEEARNLLHCYVGTEHLLLGLLREQEGVAAQVLMNLGLKLEDVREEILNLLGDNRDPGEYGSSPRRTSFPEGPDEESQDLPSDVREALRELDDRIERLNVEKEAAVAGQDFERAAHLRDQADGLLRERRNRFPQWPKRFIIDPSWLSRNNGAVAKLARVIHEERRWEDLPVLADALEEAGCTDQEILGHCRRPGRHVSGCWVLDLVLAR
jgi:ATP-dependent Clp protease ATP-binding subunit ClpA